MAEQVLLDASALLAYLHREPGFEAVRAALREGAAIGAVNLAEVLGKVREKGRDAAKIHAALRALGLQVLPFEEADAALAGELGPLARKHGLALGDRAALAQAMRRGMPVLTADRAWVELDLEVEVRVIR